MGSELEALLGQYEAGHLSRRELLGALALLVLPGAATSGSEPAIGTARHLNHATLYVRDVERSRQFYHDLFGMPILTRQGRGVNVRVGGSFIGLYPAEAGQAGRIDHVCLALERFDADATRQRLVARGLDAEVRLRGDTKELYFADPDGITVQLQDVKYRGGTGPLGDRDPG